MGLWSYRQKGNGSAKFDRERKGTALTLSHDCGLQICFSRSTGCVLITAPIAFHRPDASRHVLEPVALKRSAPLAISPSAILAKPVVRLNSACRRLAVLLSAALLLSACAPIAVLRSPLVFSWSAPAPSAVLFVPVVRLSRAP